MDWPDLGDPKPRPAARQYNPVVWPEGARIPLAIPRDGCSTTFAEIAQQRSSRRTFDFLSADRLGELLWYSCSVRSLMADSFGFPLSSRPAPSAGAIHPIHIVINQPNASEWKRYDAFAHELVEITSPCSAQDVRKELGQLIDCDAATILIFVAEPSKTASKYEQAASLVWRDAGVVQGFISAAAESMGLSCCLLGVTGNMWANALSPEPGLVGVGVACVGERLPL